MLCCRVHKHSLLYACGHIIDINLLHTDSAHNACVRQNEFRAAHFADKDASQSEADHLSVRQLDVRDGVLFPGHIDEGSYVLYHTEPFVSPAINTIVLYI